MIAGAVAAVAPPQDGGGQHRVRIEKAGTDIAAVIQQIKRYLLSGVVLRYRHGLLQDQRMLAAAHVQAAHVNDLFAEHHLVRFAVACIRFQQQRYVAEGVQRAVALLQLKENLDLVACLHAADGF